MWQSTKTADFSLLLVAFIWGTTFVLVQNALQSLSAFSFNGIRFLIAAFFLTIMAIIFYRKQWERLTKRTLMAGILLGLCLFIAYTFQTIGLHYTSSSKAGFITGLSVILVPILSIFILNIKITRNAFIGVFVATLGLYLLTAQDISAFNKGDGFVFICALGFAFHIILTNLFAQAHSAIILTIIQVTTVGLLSILSGFVYEGWSYDSELLFRQEVIFALLITSIFATGLAFLAQTHFQQFTSPTRVAVIFAMEPVFAALTGYIFAGDRLSIIAMFGCLFILLGMILAEWPQKNRFTENSIEKK
ncbi:DMT family transporter [Cytobacillus sp. FSL W7-1323]|uniref:DMT family transporter n=1 Tax=Cytobacillus sp. FSL W7-1323 TaxID=2921700 RepID=UPI003159463E